MGVTSRKIVKGDPVATETFFIPLSLLTAATTEVNAAITPGYRFQLVKVSSYCKSNTNVTVQLKIGGVSALSGGTAVTPIALTETSHALHATVANTQGTKTSQITVEAISGATPALPGGGVFVEIRPFPMDGDSYSGAAI